MFNFLLQDKAFNLVMRVLQAYKASEIEAGIKVLEKTEVDILIKYIYRGFAQSSDSASAILLAWHDKVRVYIWEYVPSNKNAFPSVSQFCVTHIDS